MDLLHTPSSLVSLVSPLSVSLFPSMHLLMREIKSWPVYSLECKLDIAPSSGALWNNYGHHFTYFCMSCSWAKKTTAFVVGDVKKNPNNKQNPQTYNLLFMKTAKFFGTFSFLKHGAGERYCMRGGSAINPSLFLPCPQIFFSW